MGDQYIKKGILTIENQILKIDNRTINIAKVDNMETYPIEKYPLTQGLRTWAKVWVVFLIVTMLFRNSFLVEFLFILYTLSIIGLLFYNYKEHEKQFYALIIKTGRTTLKIGSDSKEFLDNLLDALEKAMNSKKVNYTINLDNRVINNGIFNNGNDNKTAVIKK